MIVDANLVILVVIVVICILFAFTNVFSRHPGAATKEEYRDACGPCRLKCEKFSGQSSTFCLNACSGVCGKRSG
jgi:hypothetical protein